MAKKKLSNSFLISTLILKKINGQISPSEQAELDAWIAESPANTQLFNKMLDEGLRSQQVSLMSIFDADAAFDNVKTRIQTETLEHGKRFLTRGFYRLAAAAVLVLALGASWLFFKDRDSVKVGSTSVVADKPVNKVMLTLANGSQIDVDAAKNGLIAKQGNSAISKTADGKLNYQSADGGMAGDLQYNVLTVPRGIRYQMTLPDGSQVWLNSESTLKFPVAFKNTERVVELTGEAYFEVTHNSRQPFRVQTNNQIVEVLGTHFNIEAYKDDALTTTTLAQGSVQVSNGNDKATIKPGQLAQSAAGTRLTIAAADLEETLAWKNGLFSFKDDRVEDMMKKIARSYDVDVAYQGNVKDLKFWGTFPRAKGLNVLLKNLEQTNTIHFKLSGRRVLVMP